MTGLETQQPKSWESPQAQELFRKIDKLRATLDRPESEQHDSSDLVRKRLIHASRSLSRVLETEVESLDRVLCQPLELVCVRIGVDLSIFNILTTRESEGKPGEVTLTDLTQQTGCETALLERILRGLIAHGAVDKVRNGGYLANPITRAFARNDFANGVKFVHDIGTPSGLAMPAFLRDKQYQKSDQYSWLDSPASVHHKIPPGHSVMDVNEEAQAQFMAWIPCYKEGQPDWLDYYPFQQNIDAGFDPSANTALFVDVAGNDGSEMMRLKHHFPALPGRLILQDLPVAIDNLPANHADVHGFELMSCNFFEPQPVHGARVYYMRLIMHDHPDPAALRILAQLRDAMKPGYSRLLINDMILPDDDVDAGGYAAVQDLLMLSLFGALERKEMQWRKLLGDAGFEVLGMYRPEEERRAEGMLVAKCGGIIECQVAV